MDNSGKMITQEMLQAIRENATEFLASTQSRLDTSTHNKDLHTRMEYALIKGDDFTICELLQDDRYTGRVLDAVIVCMNRYGTDYRVIAKMRTIHGYS